MVLFFFVDHDCSATMDRLSGALIIRNVIGDVRLLVVDLQVLCNLRSVLIVDQRGPIRSGSLVLKVALLYRDSKSRGCYL